MQGPGSTFKNWRIGQALPRREKPNQTPISNCFKERSLMMRQYKEAGKIGDRATGPRNHPFKGLRTHEKCNKQQYPPQKNSYRERGVKEIIGLRASLLFERFPKTKSATFL